MRSHTSPSKAETFNFRLNPVLKAEFLAATETEAQPAAEVLRDFIASYVEKKRRKHFQAEARRQSMLIASSPGEKEAMDWARDVNDTEGWK